MSYARRRGPVAPNERARLAKGNNTLVRICMIGFGLAIVSLAPVTWPWKIALFLAIMFLVGMVIPIIGGARRVPMPHQRNVHER
jgi:hypothetical protein